MALQDELQERGHSRWSSRTKYLNVWIAAPISFSQLANNSSSTINNSRTNPNAAKIAKGNEPRRWDCRKMAATTSGWRPKPFAQDASGKLPCRSSPRRGVRCFAVSASSSARRLLHQRERLAGQGEKLAEAFCLKSCKRSPKELY